MQTIGRPIAPERRTSEPIVGAVLIHALLLATFIHWSTPWVAPIRLPGSEHGSNLLLTYSPGRAPIQSAASNPKAKPKLAEAKSPLPKPPAAKVKDAPASPNTNSPVSAQPDSTAGADALGSGNINIALANYFPAPKPDLSSLPPGTRGDVILDIVIDANGKISDLKMTHGLGHGIDETVIATVHQWTFHPATRDGQPVASEQELHFHYERG
jgi:TonB family C-terminal domain